MRHEKSMVGKLKSYCIHVLDKIMVEWYNKNSPGFMCVGSNPHPFNNECNTILVSKHSKNLNLVSYSRSCSFTKIYFNTKLDSTIKKGIFHRPRKFYHM